MPFLFFHRLFSTQPNFTSVCPCLPRCERDEYRVVVSTALLSQHSAYQNIFNRQKPQDYEAAIHIQVNLNRLRKNVQAQLPEWKQKIRLVFNWLVDTTVWSDSDLKLSIITPHSIWKDEYHKLVLLIVNRDVLTISWTRYYRTYV